MNILKRRLTAQQFNKATQQERNDDIALLKSRSKLKQRFKALFTTDKLTLIILLYIAVIIT